VTTGLDLIISNKHVFGLRDLTSPAAAWDYFVHGKGPFTSSVCEAVGVFNGSIQLMAMMAGLTTDGGLLNRHALNIKDEVRNNIE